MNKKNIFLTIAVTSILVSAFFFGCKDATDAGIGIIPEDALVKLESFDTLAISAYTYQDDSVLSSKISKGLLGCYIDPVFGKTRASFVTQIAPGIFNDFGTNAIADSMRLFLRYNADTTAPIYGNMNTQMLFKIYEINSELAIDSNYYTWYKPEWLDLGNVLADTLYYPQDGRNDTIIFNVSLSKTFAQQLIDDFDEWNDVEDPRDTSFLDYFNGIYIESSPIGVDGSLTIFDLLDAETKAILYYHNDEDTLSLTFYTPTIGIRFNMIEQIYDASGFLPDLDNPEAKEDSVVYIQGLGGLKVKLKMPGLDSLKNAGSWGVNKAEIILKTEENILTNELTFPAPLDLNIYAINEDGSIEYVTDYIGQSSYLGAPYEDGVYKFDITYYVQQILNGDVENNGLYIVSGKSNIDPSRVVLTGTKHSNPLKLALTLRKLD